MMHFFFISNASKKAKIRKEPEFFYSAAEFSQQNGRKVLPRVGNTGRHIAFFSLAREKTSSCLFPRVTIPLQRI
jgi:hypothetical protein